MVRLVPVAQAFQYLQRLFTGWFADIHRLEPSFQRSVFFYMLPVFVYRRSANHLNLAPRKHGLQYVGSIHRTLGRARAHYGVQLVNKHNHIAVFFQFLQRVLQALLKFTTELGSCKHARQVKRNHPAVFQHIRHVACNNLFGKPFRNGGFANARLAYQHRIVFCPPGKDLDDSLNFFRTANHRVKLVVSGSFRQVKAKLIQFWRLRFRFLLRLCGTLANRKNLLLDCAQIRAYVAQHAEPHALAFIDDGQQHMLCPNIPMPQLPGKSHAHLDDFFGPGRISHHLRPAISTFRSGGIHILFECLFRDPLPFQNIGGSAPFQHQPHQKMLGAHIIFSIALCNPCRFIDSLLGSRTKTRHIIHHNLHSFDKT